MMMFITIAISWERCLCVFMRLRSNTGAGQPVALIMTRMATALAKIRPGERDVGLYDDVLEDRDANGGVKPSLPLSPTKKT